MIDKSANSQDAIKVIDLSDKAVELLKKELKIDLAWLIAADRKDETVYVLGVPELNATAKPYGCQKDLISELPKQWELRSAEHIQLLRIAASPLSTLISIPNPSGGGCIWVKIG